MKRLSYESEKEMGEMKPFMDENFLLSSCTAEKLYHNYAEPMPVFDYHCHLNPREIAEDKRYRSITEIWLGGDHYKWRAMRTHGVSEAYITGYAEDKAKFLKWAEVMPYCVGNPLYHWTHLELKTYFGIEKLLGPDTAEEIWEECNEQLWKPGFSARGLIQKSNVKVVCTTDDPVDALEFHQQIAADREFDTKILPTFRPDKALNIDKEGFVEYIGQLGAAAGMEIHSLDDLLEALDRRMNFFHKIGCRISDHGLDPIVFCKGTAGEAESAFKTVLRGGSLNDTEIAKFKTQVLLFLGRRYAALGWVMQLHMGALRNNNSRMMRLIGPDTGFDAIGDFSFAQSLSLFMDALDTTGELPKTILYCLNPRDNEVLGTIIGCFQDGSIPGKIQFGSGWWFNDQKDGMQRQMTALANLSLLSRFVGMLTDSRSFLSFTRHEYFRRILCNLLGEWVENGEAPGDMELLGKMVQDISFHNARRYFGIAL